MPKQLINLIGILISIVVLALGIFLIALPLATQALATLTNAGQVDQTNLLYQAQVDALTKAKENKSQIDAQVAALRGQIPEVPQLDDVFGLVGQASQSSGVTITGITADASAPFAARTAEVPNGESAPSPSPSASPSARAEGPVGQAQQVAGDANAQTAQTNAGSGAATPGAGSTVATSTRSQISITITVTAAGTDQVTAFLDALRAGPRLLANITSTVTQNNGAAQASVTALTFVDGAPVATGASK